MENDLKINIRTHSNGKKSLSKKNAFFFEGGGTKGVYAIGVLKYLFGKNPYIDLSKVDIFGGTSVGSFLAAALSLGYSHNNIDEISKLIDIGKLIDSKFLFLVTLYRFVNKGYLYDDVGRQDIVKQILNLKIDEIQKHLKKSIDGTDITFGDLKFLITNYPEIYKHLVVNSVDINTSEQIFMTTLDNNFDNIKLFDALLASSAIPFVFKPTILYKNSDSKYVYIKTSETTINHFVDGGTATNNPLDYFLLHDEKFNEYNLWLLKFTNNPSYVNIDGNVQLLRQLVQYLISGKNDIKSDLIQEDYQINTINLYLKSGTLDIYTQDEIQKVIKEIYSKCFTGELHFGN